MSMCSCLGMGMMGYIVRCISDDLVSYVINFDNKLSISFVNIGVS